MADDYNIGNFGEFDRFEDERAFMPEAFERPQSTIGGYDKKFGYTLPSVENENPDNWFWGYNNPDDAVQEQQHGVWPSIKRNSPEWVKDIGKGLHDTGKLFYDHGRYSDDILDFFGWQPQDNYYDESMNERFNWDQQSEIHNWYKWYDKLIKRFGKEKGSQLWHQYASRGGIMGLV